MLEEYFQSIYPLEKAPNPSFPFLGIFDRSFNNKNLPRIFRKKMIRFTVNFSKIPKNTS